MMKSVIERECVVWRRKFDQWVARLSGRHVVTYSGAPVVSISFDDYPKSALDIGGEILAEAGVRATYFASFGLADTDSAVGPIGSAADLASCVARGHELGCHTYEHLDCGIARKRQIIASLAYNQYMATAHGAPQMRQFAYPWGGVNAATKRAVMEHYQSARTVRQGINVGRIDLGLLKAVPLYSRCMAASRDYLDALHSSGGWLIYYLHDVAEMPSPYGCTPAELRMIIFSARMLGFRFAPIGEVVERLRNGDDGYRESARVAGSLARGAILVSG